MEHSLNLGDLKPIETMEPLNVGQYEGARVEIEKCEVVDMTTSYNDEGVWVEGLKRPTKRLKVSTKPLTKVEVPGKESFEIRASMIFALKETKDEKTGQITGYGWSTNKNSKLMKFMKMMKVNKPDELIGKYVTVLTRPSKKDEDREFLGFKVE